MVTCSINWARWQTNRRHSTPTWRGWRHRTASAGALDAAGDRFSTERRTTWQWLPSGQRRRADERLRRSSFLDVAVGEGDVARNNVRGDGVQLPQGECDGGCARRPTWLSRCLKCDTCGRAIGGKFYDAATKDGPWASCVPVLPGLSAWRKPARARTRAGVDQRADGKYEKTAGWLARSAYTHRSRHNG